MLCATLAVGCGRVSFDAVAPGSDASDASDDASPVIPVEMVLVPTDSTFPSFLIDRYEESIPPNAGMLGTADQDQDGDGKLADPAVAAAHGLLFDDDGGETAVVLTTVVARSAANTVPTGSLSWYQAAAACVNAGKRLCTNQEWIWACGGPTHTIYTYDSNTHVAGMCNEGPGIAPTGTFSQCTNAYGVYDMNANVQEWTEWHSATAVEYRGGAEDEGASSARCNYGNPSWLDTDTHPDIGFRCCRRLGG